MSRSCGLAELALADRALYQALAFQLRLCQFDRGLDLTRTLHEVQLEVARALVLGVDECLLYCLIKLGGKLFFSFHPVFPHLVDVAR